jgi:hypothetical protein
MGHSIMPEKLKFELHAYGVKYDVSNSMKDWRELEVTVKRDGTSGAYREISFPFQFTGEAYGIVENLFDTYGFRARAEMHVYERYDGNDPSKLWRYGAPEIFSLDFTGYEKDNDSIGIPFRRPDLFSILSSRGKINFEIPVSEIREQKPWFFERIMIENSFTAYMYSEEKDRRYEGVSRIDRIVGSSPLGEGEVTVPGIMEVKNLSGSLSPERDMWFAGALQDTELDIEIDIKEIDFHMQGLSGSVFADSVKLRTGVFRETDDGNDSFGFEMIAGLETEKEKSGNGLVFDESADVPDSRLLKIRKHTELKAGEKLYFMLNTELSSPSDFDMKSFLVTANVKLSYYARQEALSLDAADPERLLQSLVNKITGSETAYTARIEDFNTDGSDKTLTVAAESIREIEGAKIYTSYDDFREWMATQGYEPDISGSELAFRKRERIFDKGTLYMELQENECADLREYVDSEYLFSGLKIGYKSSGYDSEGANSKIEFNGTHSYSTDLEEAGGNVLELISPYRADCYGIEFLAQTRGKKTEREKADKDLFLINVAEKETRYETVRGLFSGDFPGKILETLFNGKFNPFNLVMLNESLTGISARQLKFTSSDANSALTVNHQATGSDYVILSKLFDATVYDIAGAKLESPPGNPNGTVKISYRGKVYTGFVAEISSNPAWETETVWKLRKFQDSPLRIAVAEPQLDFDFFESEAAVPVYISGENKGFTTDALPDWISAEKYGNALIIRVKQNSDWTVREFDITVRPLADTSRSAAIHVRQAPFG